MAPFQYQPLTPGSNEIRLLHLLPSDADAPIRISLTHFPLEVPRSHVSQRLTAVELQKTLPAQWYVKTNIEGRYFFVNGSLPSHPSSWEHPDPEFPRNLYEGYGDTDDEQAHPYEALSYAWGSAQGDELAYIETITASNTNTPKAGTLKLGRNLVEALRHLRYKDSPRTLWIDAVYINQQDESEKSSQLMKMRYIFKLARRVVVWLGPSSETSGAALRTLARIGSYFEYTQDCWFFTPPHCEALVWGSPWESSAFKAGALAPISVVFKLLRRDWFVRVWTLEEIMLASRHSILNCGADEISWTLLRKALLWMAAQLEGFAELEHEQAFLILRNSMNLSCRPFRHPAPLSDVFRAVNERKCVNPRDKVYGTLGLLSTAITNHITPDYSLPVAEVYKQIFLEHVNSTHRLELIHMGRRSNFIPGLPTWTPDWQPLHEGRMFIGIHQLATGNSAAQVEYIAPKTLRVAAIFCGTIQSTSEPFHVGMRSEDLLELTTSYLSTSLEPGPSAEGQRKLDEFLDVLFIGHLKERYPGSTGLPTLQEARQILNTHYESHIAAKLSFSTDRRFVRTAEGYLGMGSLYVQPGDLIYAVLGSYNLVVLRRSDPSTTFEVIGDVYASVLTCSEAVLGPLPSTHSFCFEIHTDGYPWPFFKHKIDGVSSIEDPRLGPLPDEWERVDDREPLTDPHYSICYRNRLSGKVINSDPRLTPEALTARGVKVETIELV